MAQAYTPGLTITRNIILRKDRILPLKGEVVVSEGDTVKSEDIVAKTELPGDIVSINVGNKLSLPPKEVPNKMLKKAGEEIKKGEILAITGTFFGLFKSKVLSPMMELWRIFLVLQAKFY